MTSTLTDRSRDHHGLPAHEVVLLLESDPVHGLTSAEAAERLRRFGRNVLPTAKSDGPVTRILRQLNHPLVLILIVAQAALTYLPLLNTAFDTAPLDLLTWAVIAVLATAAWAVVALDKRIRHRIV